MAGSCLEVFVMAITLIFSAPSESKPTQDPPALPCEAPCWCDGLSLMNCSSSGISTLPMTIPESVTVLDLTHNNIMSLSLPDSESGIDKLKHLLLGYNKISHLSLCVVPGLPVTNPGYTPLPGFSKRFGNGVRSACASNLELLSVERNHLKNIPKGLGHLRSLQVIQLSHNRISAVHMEDLQNCNKLSAIYLQHNQITTIDPLAFQDLRELKVLNLSNNDLTTIQPTIFVSLSNLQLELDVTNNNWICDCDLLDVKKWITVLSEGRQQSWCIVCKEPSQLSSQDLRNLEDFELSGETSVHQTSLSQEVAAYVGKKLVLPCSGNQKQDSDLLYWWTPHGQISKNSKGHFKLNNIGSLVINNVQESDGGLYVCIFGEIQTRISVLDIRLQENNPVKLVRKSRGADFLTRQGRTHSDFVLAVCLSVIITFICAFALGVVARPFLDHLWKKIHPQKSATGHIYENEGFAEERETGGRKEQTMHDEIHIPVIKEDASDSRPQPNTPHYVTIHPVLPSSENQQDSSLESSNYQQALQKESRDDNPDLESVNTEDVPNVSSNQLPASSEKSQHFNEVHDNRSGNIKDDFHTQHESKEISNASQHGVSLENDTPSETANEIHPVLNDNLQDDPQNHQINHFDSDVIMEPPNCKEEKEHSAFSITKPDTQHNREDTAITVSKQVNVPNLSHLGRELEGHLFKEAEEEDVDFKFSDLCAKNDPWEASKTDPKGSDEVLPTQQDTKQNMNFSEAFAVHSEVLTDQNTSDECENESCKSQKQGRDFLNASHLTKEEDSPSNYKENEYERVLSKEQLTIEGKPSQNDRMEDNRLITANAEDVTEEEDVDQQKGFFNPDDDSHSNPPSEFGNDSGDSFEFSDSFNDTEYGNLLDFNLAQQLKTEAWPPFGESTSCILNPNQALLDLPDNLDGSAEKPNHSLLQAPSNNVLSPKDVDDVNQLDTMFPELDYERYDYTTGSKDDHFNEVHDNRSGSIKDDFHTQHESKEISNASQHGVSLENDTPSEKANEIHPVLNDNLQDDPQNHQINHFDSDVIMEPPNCKEEKEHSAFSITKPDTQHNREDTAITVSKQVNVPNLSHLGRELEGHLFKEAEEEDVDFKFSDLCAKNDPWEASKTDPKRSDEVLPTQQDTKQNMNFSEAFAVHSEVLTDQNTSDECENESCKSQKQGRDFLNASHLTKEEDSPSNYKENEYERVLSKEQLTIEGKPSQNDRMEDNRLITANAEDVTEEEDVDQQKGFFNPDDDSHSNPPSEFGNDSGDSFEFSDSFNDTEYGNLLDFNLAQQLKTEAWPPFGESTSCILNPNQALLDLPDNLDGSAEKPNHSLLQAPSNNVLSPKDVDDVNQLDTMFPELDYERYDYTTGSKDDHFNEVHDNRSGSIKDDFHTQHESKEISNASQHGVSLENDTPSEKANEIHPVLNDNLQDDPQNHQINHFDSDVIMEPPNCKEEKEHSAFSITKPDTQHNREDTAITVSKQVNVPNLSQLGRELEVHLFKEAEEEDVDFKFSDLRSKNDPWQASKTDPKGSDEVLPTQQDTKQNMNFSEAFAVHSEVLTDQNTSDECENESCKSQKQEQHFLNASHLTKEEDSPSNYKENEYERVLSKEQLTIEGKPSQNDRMEDNRLITANAEDVTEEEDVDQQKGFFNPDDDSHSNPPSEFGNDSGDSFEFSDSFNDTEYGNLLDFNLAQQLKTEAWPPFGGSTSCILNPNQTLLDLQDNLDGSAEKPNHSLLQAPSNNVLSPKGVEDVNQLDTMFPELDYERYDYTTGSKVDHSEQQVSKETTLENVLINQEALDVYSPVPVYNRDTDTSVEQWPDKDDKSSKEFEIPVSSTGFSADDWIVFDNPGFAESDWSTTWKSLPQSPVVQSNTDVVEDQETFVPSDIAGNSDIQTSQIQNEDDILTNSSLVTETDLRTEDDHATKLLAIQPFKSSKTELFPTQPCDWLLTIEPSANPRDNSTTKHLHDKHSVMSAEDETESEKKLPHSKQKLDWAKGGFFVQKKKVIDNFTPAFHPSLKPIVKTSSPSKEYTESITTKVANMTFTSLVKKNEDTPAHTNTFLTDAYSPELSSETVLSTVRYTEQNKVPVFNEGSNETVKYQDSSSKENISTDNGQYHAGEQGCRIYNPMTDYPITVGDEAFAENLTATRTKTAENSNVTFVLESSNDEGSEV